ncbi:MAG: hypothetical protein ACLQVL_14395 [Terriglobia bacterium]
MANFSGGSIVLDLELRSGGSGKFDAPEEIADMPYFGMSAVFGHDLQFGFNVGPLLCIGCGSREAR